MIRVDAYFLYQVGAAIHPLLDIGDSWTKAQVRGCLWSANAWLDTLLNKSVYRLQTCRVHGDILLKTIKRLQSEFSEPDADLEGQIDFIDHHFLTTQAKDFETVLSAELQWGQLFLVQPKGGYDLAQLTESGIVIFPAALPEKAPDAIQDAQEAARCIAFELPTAAAFHLHRVNELVLRRYYDAVTDNEPRPINRNIGAYIDAMKNHHVGDKKIFGALAVLKDFHRNPVLHPDDHLDSVEEAIALHGMINTALTYMLSVLPPAELKLVSPPADENIAKQIEENKDGQQD